MATDDGMRRGGWCREDRTGLPTLGPGRKGKESPSEIPLPAARSWWAGRIGPGLETLPQNCKPGTLPDIPLPVRAAQGLLLGHGAVALQPVGPW